MTTFEIKHLVCVIDWMNINFSELDRLISELETMRDSKLDLEEKRLNDEYESLLDNLG